MKGAVRIIKCKEGYTLNVDSNVAICHSNKKWSDEKSASCEQSTSTTATSTTTTPLPVTVFNSWDVDFKSGKALSSDGTMDAAITVYEMRERQSKCGGQHQPHRVKKLLFLRTSNSFY